MQNHLALFLCVQSVHLTDSLQKVAHLYIYMAIVHVY